MVKIKLGCYRRVYIIGGYVIKFPRLSRKHTLKRWCIGYLSNCSEIYSFREAKVEVKKDNCPENIKALQKLCPIYFNFFGFLLIMPKTMALSEIEYSNFSVYKKEFEENNFVVVWDWKKENFGKFKNVIVLVDYANDFRGNRFEQNCFWFK